MIEEVPWKDAKQTGRLYTAENEWMKSSPVSGRNLNFDDSVSLLRQVTGRKTEIRPDERMFNHPHMKDVGGMMHRGHLYINPSMHGDNPVFRPGELTHEGSHVVAGRSGHGFKMARTHLDIVRSNLGEEEANSLQNKYDHFKVGYRAGR